MNLFLYTITVLIWGTTWLAIYFQLGDIPVLVSVFYRFALATIMLLPMMFLLGKLGRVNRRDHLFILAQGACLFCFNFICFYNATRFINSGLVSVVFSLATIYNIINNRLFFKEAISRSSVIYASMGVCGLTLLFWQDFTGDNWSINSVYGVGLAALGTAFFSLGNMISKRNSQQGIAPLTTNAWGMLYGSVILALIIFATHTPLTLPDNNRYLLALFYLSLFGSVIGFTTYMMLIARIGANRAAYATVMFPIIALLLSSIFETYQWHWTAVAGLMLTIAGNLAINGKFTVKPKIA